MCLAGKKEQIMFSQQQGKTPENALITFIFINWGIIIHFTTNWSLGAPVRNVELAKRKIEPDQIPLRNSFRPPFLID